jgi:cytochrome b involved in lipid metabolism
MLYWRIAHFYWIHRTMHPWWDRNNTLAQGDLGAVLYRYVHSHHHKSYNPTSWSGISMYPVESISYISAALIPLMFRCGCHPWIHLYTKLDLVIGAQIGHDGFDAPGGASYFHQLHHAHFECNYGDAAGIPFDWLFGTFEDGSSYKPAREQAKRGLLAKADDSMGVAQSGEKNKRKRDDDGNEPDSKKQKTEQDASRPITMAEVAKHKTRGDCWIVLHGRVLDVTDFLMDHPGGDKVILAKAGTDATETFESIHKKSGGIALVQKWAPDAAIGIVPDLIKNSEEAEDMFSSEAHLFSQASAWSVCLSAPLNTGTLLEGVLAQLSLNLVFAVACAGSWTMLMGTDLW